jgi:hypothetical protein
MTDHTTKDIRADSCSDRSDTELVRYYWDLATMPIVEYKIEDGKVAKGECIVTFAILCAVQYVKVEANAKFPDSYPHGNRVVIVLKGLLQIQWEKIQNWGWNVHQTPRATRTRSS